MRQKGLNDADARLWAPPDSTSTASCTRCCTSAGARGRGRRSGPNSRRLALKSQIRRAGWFNWSSWPDGQRRSAETAQPATRRVLPMELQVGDRLADETGARQVIGRMYMSNAGKNAHVRVKRVGQPDVSELRTWGARERVTVKRAAAEDRNQ